MSCEFCDLIHDGNDAELVQRIGPGMSRVVPVGENVVVMPTLGALSAFHALVVPTEHIMSSAAAATLARGAIWGIAELLRSRLCTRASSAVLFEHGLTSRGGRGCGIAHAHVHVLEVPASIVLPLPPGHWTEHQGDIGTFDVDPESEHLLVSTASGRWAVRYESGVPSQFLRRWLASHLKVNEWDWRDAGSRDSEIRAMSVRLSETLSTPAITGA